MKKLWIMGLLFGIFGCKSYNTTTVETNPTPTPNVPATPAPEGILPEELLGKKSRTDLEKSPFNSWFDSGVSGYSPDAAIVSEIARNMTGVDITIFMGTWCGDSKEQVPRFYKILDAAKYDQKNVTLITVDRGKTTPEKFEQGLNITNVPTFLFYKGGKEIGRIVELPVETLEKDMLKIISGKEYHHSYER